MRKILIDTDILLDFFFDRQPYSEDASKILMLCEKGSVQGYVTPVIICNVYYLLRKTAKHDKVIENLKLLIQILEIAIVSKATLLDALNSDFKDFEDAIQNISAQHENDIGVILTRNLKDFKGSSLAVMTPETYLQTIELR